jgi:Sigma-70 region 3
MVTGASGGTKQAKGGDVQAGRRLSIAMEALGEALGAIPGFPDQYHHHAELLSQGRSTVPADGEIVDFVGRLRAALNVRQADFHTDLSSWLGTDLARWSDAHGPRDALELARSARRALLDRKRSLADVYARWYGEGLSEDVQKTFTFASKMALCEAVDRWCALGCEGSLDRYVSTWQRSASGWAESVLGTAVDVDVSDLALLRTLRSSVDAARRDVREAGGYARALSKHMGVSVSEVERLLRLEAAVRDRLDPQQSLKRRWAIVKPIAQAVSVLEQELGRLPSVSEIAERAGVHEAAVELAMESLGDD